MSTVTQQAKERSKRTGPQIVVPTSFFLGVWAIYLLTIATQHISVDAYASSLSAWRIATTGVPWMEGVDLSTFDDSWLVTGADGHLVHNRFAGTVLPAVPFYWLVDLWSRSFSLVGGGLAAATLTALTATLLFLALRRLMPTQLAVAAAAVFALATPTWSVSADGMWGHTVTQLGIAGAVWCAGRGRWLSAGAWIGLGMLARPHIALIGAVIGLGVAWSRRDPRIAILMAIPTTASLGVLSLWNRIIYGRWSLRGGYEDYVVDVADSPLGGVSGQVINYLGFLAAADRGVLIWTPVLVLLLPLVATSWKSLPDWVRWLALSGLVYTAAQLQVNVFHGGYAFYGYRHGLELITCLLPACALSVQKAGRAARIGILAVVALQSFAIATGAISEDYFVRSDQIVSVNAFGLALTTGPAWLPLGAGVVILLTLTAGILLDLKRNGRRDRQMPI